MTGPARPNPRAPRPAVHTLAVTALLFFFTTLLGMTFGADLLERVNSSLETVQAELVRASAVHRDHVLHVRADVRHVLGGPIDRVAVADLAAGNAYVRMADGSPDPAAAPYEAGGWMRPDGSGCAAWNATVRPWPADGAFPLPAAPCEIHAYQRVGGGPPDRLGLGDGNTAALEFVIAGVDPPPAASMGLVVEYGRADRTELTGDADVTLHVEP